MSNEKTVKCKYIFDDNYNPKYVNGLYGGLSPRGEFVVNFFMERKPIPNSQEFTFNEENNQISLSEEDPQDLQDSLVRFVDTGIVFDYPTAKDMYEWLGSKIAHMESLFTQDELKDRENESSNTETIQEKKAE